MVDIDTQSEINYIINHFDEHFRIWKGKRIILHGALETAEAIISRFHKDYHFEGLVPYDNSQDASSLGLQVLNCSAVADKCDLVILTEFRVYAQKAFFSLITECDSGNYQIYSMYGVDLRAAYATAYGQGYLGLSGLKEPTKPYDVISMMILDTLTEDEGEALDSLRVRTRFRKLVQWLEKQGKTVIYVGRKKYSDEFFKEFLIKEKFCSDITDANNRYFCRTHKDLNFRALRERFPDKKILHIGTDVLNDCIVPKRYGIDTFRMVPNPSTVQLPQMDHKMLLTEDNIRELTHNSEKAEMVSFDIFDTLLVRKVLFAEDVYEFVDLELRKKGIIIKDFAIKRRQIAREMPHGTLKDYYNHPFYFDGISPDELVECEFQAEYKLVMPRTDILKIFCMMKRLGKRIVLTSDIHLTSKQLNQLLQKCGVKGYEKIFVSCEYGLLKREGLFEKVKEYARVPDDSIIHIGDYEDGNLRAPQYYFKNTITVPPISEFAIGAGWKEVFRQAKSFEERSLLGFSIAQLFSDTTEKKDVLDNTDYTSRFIVGAMAPMITGFMTKLIDFAEKTHAEKILFTARDGWLLKRIYDKLKEMTKKNLPEGLYFYANRHAAFLAVCDDFSKIPLILSMEDDLNPEMILEKYYGLDKMNIETWDGETDVVEYIKKHSVVIRETAINQRNCLKKYLNKVDLSNSDHSIYVDFVSADTTRSYLQQATGIVLEPLYFCFPDYCDGLDYLNCYCETENNAFLKNYLEMETYLTSPEPSLDRWNEKGDPVFAPEIRTKEEIVDILDVQCRVEAYILEWFELFYQGGVISSVLCEELYAADGDHYVKKNEFDDWGRFRINYDQQE